MKTEIKRLIKITVDKKEYIPMILDKANEDETMTGAFIASRLMNVKLMQDGELIINLESE